MCEKFLLKKARYIDQGTIFLKKRKVDPNFLFFLKEIFKIVWIREIFVLKI